MLNINKGPVNRAQKVVIYGVEGIGKTTLASKTPDPLFIDVEGGTTHLDVKRTDPIHNWPALIDVIGEVARTPGVCETLVIDTADWAEQMAAEHLCAKKNVDSIEGFGYGKGYTYLAEEFGHLLEACDRVIGAGVHVVILAHAKQRKVELPDELGAFDSWGLKLTKQTAPMLKEWSDALLFANYKTYVVEVEQGKRKAQGGKRVIYTSHSPVWDAKNRHGLPDEVDMDYASIAPIFGPAAPKTEPQATAKADLEADPTPKDMRVKLRRLMEQAGIEEPEIQAYVGGKGHFPNTLPVDEYPMEYLTKFLLPNWDRIADIILADPNHLPF